MSGMRKPKSLLVAVVSTGLIGSGAWLAMPPAAHAATTVAPNMVGARAGATRIPFTIGSSISASVDVGTGNLMVTTQDARVPGAKGRNAGFGLSYNSLESGAWSTPLYAGLTANSDGSQVLTDTDGREGTFTPVAGSSTAFTSPAGFKKSLVKNSDGSFTLTDLPNNSKEYFNSSGALTRIADRNQTVETLNRSFRAGLPWSPGGSFLSSVSLAGGNSVTVATDGQGELTGFTPTNHVGPTAGTVSYSYEQTTPPTPPNQPTHAINTGRLSQISVTNVAGGSAVTTFTYTSGGDLATITDPTGAVTTVSYDSSHRVTAVAQGNGADTATTRFQYLSSSSTNFWTDVASPTSDQSLAPWAAAHTVYDLTGAKLVSSVNDALRHIRSATYTPQSDVQSSINGVGGTTANTFPSTTNSGNSSTSPTGADQAWKYGNPGASAYEPSSSTDAQGNSSSSTYDSTTGAPTSSINGSNDSSKVSYNTDGTVKTSTDPAGHVTTYTESSTGQYTSTVTPPNGSAMGATTITGAPATSVTNGAGQATTYTYDGLYNVTKQSSADGAISYGYDKDGRVTSRQDPNQTTRYTYTTRGDLAGITTTATTSQATSSAVGYTYDLDGNMTSRTVNGVRTTYGYNVADQLTSMTTTDGALTAFGYDADNRRVDTWWHTTSDHTQFAAHTHNVFDHSGRITQNWTSLNNDDTTKVLDRSYSYAKAGKDTNLVQAITDNLASTNNVTTLGYDTSNRVASATNWDGHDYVYHYDHNGNRTAVLTGGTTTQSRTFNADNEITTTGYTYDKAGRRTADPTLGAMTYNTLGQMTTETIGSTTATSVYAGAGQNELTRETGYGNTDYVYGRANQAGIPVLEQSTTSGTATTYNNDAAGQPLDYHDANGDHYIIYDGIGRDLNTASSNGLIEGGMAQTDPYGTTEAQPHVNPFTTKMRTNATGGTTTQTPWTTLGISSGLTSNYIKRGARWNDTTTGTWTSLDALTLLNDPTNGNRFAFAADDPINLSDPNGRDARSSCVKDIYSGSIGTAIGGFLVGGPGGAFAGFVGGAAGGTVACAFDIYDESGWAGLNPFNG